MRLTEKQIIKLIKESLNNSQNPDNTIEKIILKECLYRINYLKEFTRSFYLFIDDLNYFIDSYDEVTKNFYQTLNEMTNDTVRPDFWGGFSFTPYYFEFWQGHENRLNKRHVFEQQEDEWIERFLQP